jgi:hypothetical protein
VWKSNPPFGSRRVESPALKAGKVTGPLSPPLLRDKAHYKAWWMCTTCGLPAVGSDATDAARCSHPRTFVVTLRENSSEQVAMQKCAQPVAYHL